MLDLILDERELHRQSTKGSVAHGTFCFKPSRETGELRSTWFSMKERYVGNPQRVRSHMAHFVLNPPAKWENYTDLILNEIEIRRQPTKGTVIPNTKTTFVLKFLIPIQAFEKARILSLDKMIHFKSFKSNLSLRKRHAFQVRLKWYTFLIQIHFHLI